MTSPLSQALELVVRATTADSERGFARLGDAADSTAKRARDSGEAVARASDRVQQARLREADAADAVRVAEVRLQELMDRGNATATQLATANTRLEQARRRQAVATRDAGRATEAYAAAEREAETAVEGSGVAAERAALDVKGLASSAAALGGGFSVGAWARDAVAGFLDGARGAQQLAASMNATIEQGGQLAQIFGSLGLQASDLLEIQAEYASVVEQDATALGNLGVELTRNANGSVNYATSLQDTLAALQRIPDATERNRQGFRLFGEEGFKQLSTLINSSVSVEEAFARVGVPFTQADIAEVQAFDEAMMSLNLASGELGRDLARVVIPAVMGLIDGGRDLANIVGAVPGPVLAAGAASVLLGYGMRKAATEGTFLAGALARATALANTYTTATSRAAGASALLRSGVAGAAGAGRNIAGALGGPVGIGLLAVAGGVALVQSGVETFEASARDAAVAAELAEQELGSMAASSAELGAELVDNAGIVDGWVASIRGAELAVDALTEGTAADVGAFETFAATLLGTADSVLDLGIAEAGATAEIEKQREALGAAGIEAEAAQIATKGLNDLIAEGTLGGADFAEAVRAAAEAEAEQARTTDTAKAAIDAYNAVTRDAVDVTLELARAQLGERDGLRDVQQAMHELGDVVEDTATPWSEVAAATDDAIGTALDYASAAADAAVEAARATGTVLTPLAEARIRGEETIRGLYGALAQPGITDSARDQIGDLIHDLQDAQEAGDIEALLTLTGGKEMGAEVDEVTKDRSTEVKVETRGGPAVDGYLGELTADRLARIRLETRNGPAVKAYIGTLDDERLALIRVETRNGPAVDDYIARLARERLAIIRVETRGGPAVEDYLDRLSRDRAVAILPSSPGSGGSSTGAGMAGAPGALTAARAAAFGGTVELDLKLTGSLDRSQVARAERGRAHVEDIRAYEARSGTGWRSGR